MAKVEEMTRDEMKTLLGKLDYGHLACARNNRPYIVPIHFAYEEPNIYLFTTKGMKTGIIDENPEVCLQVEEVLSLTHWQSVVISGRATRLTREEDRIFAMNFVKEINPAHVPVIHEVWVGPKNRENVSVIYRLHPDFMSGRKTVDKEN
jgi:nitroimidazol reductase NimA-like FMN-containing flavoprotein (pyridoxamine 5'-phosphate oxidase superfamily)